MRRRIIDIYRLRIQQVYEIRVWRYGQINPSSGSFGMKEASEYFIFELRVEQNLLEYH